MYAQNLRSSPSPPLLSLKFIRLLPTGETAEVAVMSLRQLQRKAASVLSRDGDILRAIQSEIAHELPSIAQQQPLPSQVGGFEVEWDGARTQDVVLKRRDDAEEISVSGLLGPLRVDGEDPDADPVRDVFMKVCVKKSGFDPVLHFDCKLFVGGFGISNAYYHQSFGDLDTNKYRGFKFSCLDRQLQKTWKEYLVVRGISRELTSFLHQYLSNKEHGQYVNWLRTLEGFTAKGTS